MKKPKVRHHQASSIHPLAAIGTMTSYVTGNFPLIESLDETGDHRINIQTQVIITYNDTESGFSRSHKMAWPTG